MKYCLRYSNKNKDALKNAQEISIIYDRQNTALIDFLEEWKDKTIILVVNNIKDFEQYKEWKKLNAIHIKYPQYKMMICFNHREAAIDDIVRISNSLDIPWFTTYNITTWDALHTYLRYGVRQVYIAEALGFEIMSVAKLCHEFDVKIRVYPNVAQASIKGADPIRKFFIRPEDIPIYEPFVDVCEFWCDYEQQNVYIKIYQKKEWLGDLRFIIKDFDLEIQNTHIVAGFGLARLNCNRDCLRGGTCEECGKMLDIAAALKESGINIRRRKRRGV